MIAKNLKSIIAATVGASAVAAGAVAISLSGGIEVASARPVADVSAHQSLGVLERSFAEADALPKAALADAQNWGESGLDLSTTRYLGADEAGKYWTALDNSGNVCVIVEVPAGGMASSCRTPEDFANHGVEVALEAHLEDQYAEVYLLPDSVSLEALPPAFSAVGSNLISGDSRNMSQEDRAVVLSSETARGGFTIHLLAPTEDAEK